jgi:hypothetical protein
MPSDARKLSDWLHRQSGALQEILSKTDHLVQVNRSFRDWLGEPWADAARIAAFDGDSVVVYARDAATATLLRFRAPAVVAYAREHLNPAVTKLQINVQPET